MPDGIKKACILRWGAFGDVIQTTALFPVLKEDGYHLTLHVSERGLPIVKNNPYVDDIIEHETDSVPVDELPEYWAELAKGYDKFINLSGSVEGSLLKIEGHKEFNWPKRLRHKVCNVNYIDRQLEIAGYPDIKGRNPEMYYSSFELKWGKSIRKKHDGRFLLLWTLSGSSMHKAYPYTEYILIRLLHEYPDIDVMFVGDSVCQLLFDRTWMNVQKNRAKNYSGLWPIRKSLVMTEFADLIIGPETGVMNAAAGLDIPKIIFLSHSTHENLSKHWKNVTPLFSNVPCYPCHQLHYTLESCPLDGKLGIPICMSKLPAKMVYDAIENIYLEWKHEKIKKAAV